MIAVEDFTKELIKNDMGPVVEVPCSYLKEFLSYLHESGSIRAEVPFSNGKRNGIMKEYYPSVKLAGTTTYKNDKLVGYKKCTNGRFGNESLDCVN